MNMLNLPFFLYSKAAGLIARASLPSPFNTLLLSLYVRKFGVNLDEMEKPLSEYRSMYEFFTRKLKPGTRNFSPNPRVICAPSDGVIRDFGKIKENKLIQAKRYYYTLSSLIGEKSAPIFHEGIFVTHYLRPGDYHRFHYPVGGIVEYAVYFPGKIFPVNPTAEKKIPGLYALNERVFILIKTPSGYVGSVIIGASAVGEINISFWKELKTNTINGKKLVVEPNVRVKKGEEMGFFGMGSTIIILVEKGKFSSRLKEGEFVKAGSAVASFL